jgi:transposase
MFEHLIIPVGTPLALDTVTITPDGVQITLQATAREAPCPTCQGTTSRVHSTYQRTLADVPLAQRPVTLHLHVRRFFCGTPTCPRRTFSERLPTLVAPHARRTLRLRTEQRQLSLDLGGEPGARLAHRQGMPISPDTLLRLARHDPPTPRPTPRVLGIDDFALRKGQVYGTILIDLERRQPVDVLPVRSAAAVAAWLEAHPGVDIITRDRSGEYAEGARRGAPDAIQVADRFHLLQNVREVLQRVLERHPAALQAAPQETSDAHDPPRALLAPPVASGPPTTALAPRSRPEQQRRQERRDRRRNRYERVKELRAQGFSMQAIADQVQLDKRTVRRYCRKEQFVDTVRPRQPSKLDPFRPYLEQQLAAGADNAMQLWRDLRDHYGYRGPSRQVSRWVARHRHLVPVPDATTGRVRRNGHLSADALPRPAPPPLGLSARHASWLLLGQPEALTDDERSMVARLCAHTATLATVYTLTQTFIQMVRTRQGAGFTAWMAQAATSGIPELHSFALGLARDQEAVAAALASPYSNGQVEGQVNRLKLIKRTMYGRANFDLLRQRVLARAS